MGLGIARILAQKSYHLSYDDLFSYRQFWKAMRSPMLENAETITI